MHDLMRSSAPAVALLGLLWSACGDWSTGEASLGGPERVPILMYHEIADAPDRFVVTPDELTWQMEFLRDRGYVSITPADFYQAVFEGAPLPARPVMITVDDGYPSDRVFADILASHGMRGTYFWPNTAAMSEDEMVAIAGTGEVCGHTVSHADLALLPRDEQLAEVAGNKAWLEGLLGQGVSCFGYPYGSYDDQTAGVVEEAGFLLAFDAWGPPAPLDPALRWHYPRFEINGGMSVDEFESRLEHGH
jgi:peptidoglycan/xylan/chitin deacetylase (PgdA/CDA1 family)